MKEILKGKKMSLFSIQNSFDLRSAASLTLNMAQKSKDECSSTDSKTNELIVAGGLLQLAAGYVLFHSYSRFSMSPYLAAGAIAGAMTVSFVGWWLIFSATLCDADRSSPGSSSDSETLTSRKSSNSVDLSCGSSTMVDFPFTQKPFGLESPQGKNECWFNSGLQIVLGDPDLLKTALDQLEEWLPNVDRGLKSDQKKTLGGLLASIREKPLKDDIEQLKAIAKKYIAQIDSSLGEESQGEVADAFAFLFPNHFELTGDSEEPPLQGAPVSLHLTMQSAGSFDEALAKLLTKSTDGEYFTYRWLDLPQHLMIQINRRNENERRPVGGASNHNLSAEEIWRTDKYVDPVDVPLSLPIDQIHYVCKGFAIHCGDQAGRGHFIAYVQHEGQWWQFDDIKVEAVDQSVIDKQVKLGSFYHFKKEESSI